MLKSKRILKTKRLARKKVLYVLSGVLAAGILSGCGSEYPQLQPEEQAQIAEYAAGLLLKYDRNYESSLLQPEELAEALAVKEKEAQRLAAREASRQEAAEGSDESGTEGDPAGSAASAGVPTQTLTDIMAMEGIDFQYTGYETTTSYPTAVTPGEVYFAVDASEGSQLVVLKFDVTNQNDAAYFLDMNQSNKTFRIGWNQEESKSTLMTILLDDLTTYMGELAPGETVSLVLISEIPEESAGALSSIELTARDPEGSYEVLL